MSWWSSLRASLAVPASLPAPSVPQLGSPWSPDPSHLTRVTLAELWPSVDPSQWPITQIEALTVPAVSAVRMRIVGTLARLPLVGTSADGTPFTVGAGLLSQPDDLEPHSTTMTNTLDDLLFQGRAYWGVYSAYADGRPASVAHVPANRVDQQTGQIDAAWLEWLDRTDRGLGERPRLIRFDGPHPGLCNIGGRAIRSAAALDRSAQHAANNPVPSIELRQTSQAPMDETAIRDLIQGWIKARQSHGVGFTNSGVEVHTHGQQPEQLLIDGRNQQAVELARLAGIPASSIDAGIPGSNLTYANLRDRLHDLISFGLTPYATAISARLSMNDVTPHGTKVRFDFTELYPVTAEPAATAPTPERNPQ